MVERARPPARPQRRLRARADRRVDCTQLKAALTGVKPVDGDTAGRQLRQAIAQHARNIDVYATGRRVAFRDDRFRHPTRLRRPDRRHQKPAHESDGSAAFRFEPAAATVGSVSSSPIETKEEQP